MTRLKRDIGSEALVAEKLDIGAELAEAERPLCLLRRPLPLEMISRILVRCCG